MSAAERATRTADADELVRKAFDVVAPDRAALVAVGGYGRGELAPCSDLDVVLVHEDDADPGEGAAELWYPLWDSGARLDHAVRSVTQMTAAAEDDLRVALGLLDLRHVAGDPNLTLRVRSALLTQWRRTARDRLPALRALVDSRHDLVGELAHAAVPDLKEAYGGLRDAAVLKALVATWLVDVPHADLERSRLALLDVRDELHALTGRPTDRVAPELWPDLAERLGLAEATAAQRHVRTLGRRITHLSRLTWRRVDGVLQEARPGARVPGTRPGPTLTPVAPGVAVVAGEVVLDRDARPDQDPALLLRACAEAAERRLALNPAAVARLVREGARLRAPWPEGARHLLVRLLAAGPGLLTVWETLEETGAVETFLPEWERIRLLPHASAIHRFTVDRHVVETCVAASGLIRQVSRPDVLMVAALLHDIGKGGLTEHSVAGEPLARKAAARMGFAAGDVDRIGTLVRHHLLLGSLATSRDPDDPATVAALTARVDDPETLALLAALTEADARATAPQAWTTWRATLTKALLSAAAGALVSSGHRLTAPSQAPVPIPAEVEADPSAVSIAVTPTADGSRVTVVSGDRVGLLADIAATLSLQRTPVRGARAWNQGRFGLSRWDVSDGHLDAAVLRQRYDALRAGRVVARDRLRAAAGGGLAPTVVVHADASADATVLEVRAHDRAGVLFLALDALAGLGVTVRSAHVDTLGPQAVDVFYLQEESAGSLSEDRAAEAAHAVRSALGG